MYEVYVLEDDIDADGDLHEIEYKKKSVDDISDEHDITRINIKIRY